MQALGQHGKRMPHLPSREIEKWMELQVCESNLSSNAQDMIVLSWSLEVILGKVNCCLELTQGMSMYPIQMIYIRISDTRSAEYGTCTSEELKSALWIRFYILLRSFDGLPSESILHQWFWSGLSQRNAFWVGRVDCQGNPTDVLQGCYLGPWTEQISRPTVRMILHAWFVHVGKVPLQRSSVQNVLPACENQLPSCCKCSWDLSVLGD